MSSETAHPTYYTPQTFDVHNIEEARSIILTPEKGITTEERWEKETPFIAGQIGELVKPNQDSVLLDYGCGIGRLAKELITRLNCSVIGVDLNPGMRHLAPGYVDSHLFSICAPEMLDMMIAKGLQVDAAYAVWVIQHCFNPMQDLLRIKNALKPGGRFYILNNINRAVPTNKGWTNDGIDQKKILDQLFQEIWTAPIPDWLIIPEAPKLTFQKLYRKI